MSYLLEINLVSAQDLKPPRMTRRKKMKTYAVAWVDPSEKLKSSVDMSGGDNPTWNDKFAFMVDSQVLESLTSCLVVEIYQRRRFLKNRLIGTTRVLLCNLVNCSKRYHERNMRSSFRAFQVRLPNAEPQGILNLGFNVLQGLPCQITSQLQRKGKLALDYEMPITSNADARHDHEVDHAIQDDGH